MIPRLAWRNIWRNRRRTLITTASIVAAVFLAAVTRATQEGQYNNMVESTVGTFTGYIQIHKAGYWDESTLNNSFSPTDSLYNTIQNMDEISAIIPRIESYALAATDQQSRPAMVMGIDINAEKNLSEPQNNLQKGRYFETNDEQAAIIGVELFERLDAEIGDSLILIGQGYHGRNAAGLFPIKGTVAYPNPELNESLVYLPLETAQHFFSAPGRLTTAALVLDDPRDVDKIVQKLKNNLPQGLYEVMSWKELLPGLQQAIQADRGSGIIILMVLYMVVGFGILGTVLMMIAERSYEFGVMLSVGTSRMTIVKILCLEVLFLAMLGAGIGILLSIPVAWYFHVNPIELSGATESLVQSYAMKPIIQFSVDPSLFISQAIIVFIITLLFSIYPVIKAAKLEPIEAMRA
jgi:ABC-type lipoprotein release transport system permease subunit